MCTQTLRYTGQSILQLIKGHYIPLAQQYMVGALYLNVQWCKEQSDENVSNNDRK